MQRYKPQKFIIISIVCIFTLFSKLSFSQNVEITPQIRQFVEQYVESTITNTLLKKVDEVFVQAIKGQDLQILPQASFAATQQTVLFAFKNEDLRKMMRDVYEETLDSALSMYEKGEVQSVIQNDIKEIIEVAIKPIIKDPHFQHIGSEMLKKAMQQTRTLVTSVAVKQFAARAAIEQKMMQQAITLQYKKMIQYAVQNQVEQQIGVQKNLLQQQYQQEQLQLKQQQLRQQQGF